MRVTSHVSSGLVALIVSIKDSMASVTCTIPVSATIVFTSKLLHSKYEYFHVLLMSVFDSENSLFF